MTNPTGATCRLTNQLRIRNARSRLAPPTNQVKPLVKQGHHCCGERCHHTATGQARPALLWRALPPQRSAEQHYCCTDPMANRCPGLWGQKRNICKHRSNRVVVQRQEAELFMETIMSSGIPHQGHQGNRVRLWGQHIQSNNAFDQSLTSGLVNGGFDQAHLGQPLSAQRHAILAHAIAVLSVGINMYCKQSVSWSNPQVGGRATPGCPGWPASLHLPRSCLVASHQLLGSLLPTACQLLTSCIGSSMTAP